MNACVFELVLAKHKTMKMKRFKYLILAMIAVAATAISCNDDNDKSNEKELEVVVNAELTDEKITSLFAWVSLAFLACRWICLRAQLATRNVLPGSLVRADCCASNSTIEAASANFVGS